eukprot:7132892-Prymnesium_polylepis.1
MVMMRLRVRAACAARLSLSLSLSLLLDRLGEVVQQHRRDERGEGADAVVVDVGLARAVEALRVHVHDRRAVRPVKEPLRHPDALGLRLPPVADHEAL